MIPITAGIHNSSPPNLSTLSIYPTFAWILNHAITTPANTISHTTFYPPLKINRKKYLTNTKNMIHYIYNGGNMSFKRGRLVRGKVSVKEHLSKIDQNKTVGKEELVALFPKVKAALIECGFHKASKRFKIITEYIDLIFQTQDYRCTHWLQTKEGELNGVWNNPGYEYKLWKIEHIHYQVDHVIPKNCGGEDKLTNLQFLSPNNNQFMKCSLTYSDFLRRIDISDRLKERVLEVLEKREELFTSQRWADFIKKIELIENA